MAVGIGCRRLAGTVRCVMEVETVTTLFGLLALFGIAFLVVVVVLFLVGRASGGLPSGLVPLRSAIGDLALPFAFAVAAVCMGGSLYLSEVAKYPPCLMCWYQRIAMYPMVVLMGIAALRKDSGIKWYSVPLGLIGVSISIYHYLIEWFPDSVAHACTEDTPCSTVWFRKFGFLSIPAMAGIGFLLIVTLSLLATSRRGVESTGDDLRPLTGGSDGDATDEPDQPETDQRTVGVTNE